jgi:hypothetical protein
MTDHDIICDALRDDLADVRRERNLYHLLYLAALDGLSLMATAPERYEQIQRELRKEREQFMAPQFVFRDAPPKEQA